MPNHSFSKNDVLDLVDGLLCKGSAKRAIYDSLELRQWTGTDLKNLAQSLKIQRAREEKVVKNLIRSQAGIGRPALDGLRSRESRYMEFGKLVGNPVKKLASKQGLDVNVAQVQSLAVELLKEQDGEI